MADGRDHAPMLTPRLTTGGLHINDRWRWKPILEASAVFLLVMGYIWWAQFHYRPAVLIPLALVIGSHVRRQETPADLGFRLTNLGRCLREFGLPLLALALVLLTMGKVFDTIRALPHSRALLIVPLYSVWGLFQQYALNGYFVNRFVAASRGVASGWVPILAAAFFASTHLPNWFLVSVTCVAGYLSAKIYLKYRNLYFLGVAHGVIGSLLYVVVPDSIGHNLRVGPLMTAPPCSVARAVQPRISGPGGMHRSHYGESSVRGRSATCDPAPRSGAVRRSVDHDPDAASDRVTRPTVPPTLRLPTHGSPPRP